MLRILEVTGTRGLEGIGWLEVVISRSREILYARVGRVVDFMNADDLFVENEGIRLQVIAAIGVKLTNKLRITDEAKKKFEDCWLEDFDPVVFLPEMLEIH